LNGYRRGEETTAFYFKTEIQKKETGEPRLMRGCQGNLIPGKSERRLVRGKRGPASKNTKKVKGNDVADKDCSEIERKEK